MTAREVLGARGLTAGYGRLSVVRDLDLAVGEGEVVALLGPNGVGKTTVLATLAGRLPPLAGAVLWRGEPTAAPPHRRARQGLAVVAEDRSITAGLTVGDNLRLGRCDPVRAVELFPELEPLHDRSARLLSGGEQQMLGLARALARHPAALIVDELSLGLAPVVADRLAEILRQAAADGVAVLVVEQDLDRALGLSDRCYLLGHGGSVLERSASTARRQRAAIERWFLGGGEPGQGIIQPPSIT